MICWRRKQLYRDMLLEHFFPLCNPSNSLRDLYSYSDFGEQKIWEIPKICWSPEMHWYLFCSSIQETPLCYDMAKSCQDRFVIYEHQFTLPPLSWAFALQLLFSFCCSNSFWPSGQTITFSLCCHLPSMRSASGKRVVPSQKEPGSLRPCDTQNRGQKVSHGIQEQKDDNRG